jgi:hypothetical protein
MNNRLAKEDPARMNLAYSTKLPYSKRHPLRLLSTGSMPQLVEQPTDTTLFSRTKSSAATTQRYKNLQEDAAVSAASSAVDYRTLEDRMRDWDHAEQRLTSVLFLMWAVGVTLLGGWHLANHLSASVAILQVTLRVAVAILAATSALVAFSRTLAPTIVATRHPEPSAQDAQHSLLRGNNAPASAWLPRGKVPSREAHGVSGECGRE